MRTSVILLLAAAFAAAQDSPADEWKALQKEHNDARTEFFRPWREAKAAGKEFKLDYSKHPDRSFGPKYAAFATKHAGTDEAAHALVGVLRHGTPEKRKWATDTLFKTHMKSKAMRSVVFALRYQRDGAKSIALIAFQSPHAEVRAVALLALAQITKGNDEAAAERLLLELKQKYAEVKYGRTTMGAKADGELYELKHLGIGKVAPEIEGTDLEGNAMKLSDYKGKVILLDFWGDW